MRIAFIAHDGDYKFGANRSLVGLLDGLGDAVSPVVIGPYRGDLGETLQTRGIDYVHFPFKWWMNPVRSRRSALARLQKNLACLGPLARFLRQWGCDLVYTNSSVVPIGAMVACVLRRPHVWHIREFGDLDHGLYPDWGPHLYRRVISRSAHIVAVSDAVRAHVTPRVAESRVSVVYNGIASHDVLAALEAEARLCRSGPYTFAIVGLIAPSKGQDLAIRAFARAAQVVPDVRLVIAGDGQPSFIAECKRASVALGVASRVEFSGYVADPFRLFLSSDAALMCSRNEAMGRVTAEAMATGRPVIGVDSRGTSELIAEGRTGLLVQPTESSLAEAMIRLASNREWSRELGEQAQREAGLRFAVEVYAARILEIITGCCERRHRCSPSVAGGAPKCV